jgi:hypothetical protein
MYNHHYMRSEPVMLWSNDAHTEKNDVPKALLDFVRLYSDNSEEFGYDPYDDAYQIMEQVRDSYTDLDADEIASLAIASSF